MLAIADDALGLLIIAAFYPSGRSSGRSTSRCFGGRHADRLVAGQTRHEASGRTSLAGVVSWIGFLRGGLHPALALVPIVPFMPHAARDPGLFASAGRYTTR